MASALRASHMLFKFDPSEFVGPANSAVQICSWQI
jgi:hypothetical protein